MKFPLGLILVAVCVSACTSLLRPQGKRVELNPDESTRLAQALKEFHATNLDRAPVRARRMGLVDTIPNWDDMSEAHVNRSLTWLRTVASRLDSDFQGRTTPRDAVIRRAAKQWADWEIKELEWRDQWDALSATEGAYRIPTQVLWTDIPATTLGELEEWEQYVFLLETLPEYLGQLEAKLRRRGSLGSLPPRPVLLRARSACLAWLAGRPFTSLSSASSPWQRSARGVLAQIEGLNDEERARWVATTDRILVQKVGPAYQQFAALLDELQPQASDSISVQARTDGAAWYAYRLERIAGEVVLPASLHATGLREVARLRTGIRDWMRTTGNAESLSQFVQTLRESEQYPRAGSEDWEPILNRWLPTATERMALLGKDFQTEPLEILTPNSTYWLEPLRYDREVPGLASHPDGWQEAPLLIVETLCAAKGIPGRHLRVQWQTNSDAWPTLIQSQPLPAWEAGWDLYAARWADELGLYSGPEAQLGQLLWELWSMAKLVVDTGIHNGGWTAEQAEQYFSTNSVFRREVYQRTVRDIIERPAANVAPALGLLQIEELRETAKSALGEIFVLNEFHRALLDNGVLPIPLLREQLRAWAAE